MTYPVCPRGAHIMTPEMTVQRADRRTPDCRGCRRDDNRASYRTARAAARLAAVDVAPLPPISGHLEGGWRESALCRQIGSDDWFLDQGGKSTEAKAMCARCPVREQCLDETLRLEGTAHGKDRHGVWGGLTGMERAELARTVAREAV